jgi:hypothetical protein
VNCLSDLYWIIDPPYNFWLKIILEGGVAGFALFLGHFFFYQYKLPELNIDKNSSGEEFDAIRVKVSNSGRSAAKNCKGKIKLKNISSRI